MHTTLHAHGHHHGNAAAARSVVASERKILKSLGKGEPYDLHHFAQTRREMPKPELPTPIPARYLGKVIIS